VAELHVTNATASSVDALQISFDTVGPGQCPFKALEAYRPTLQLMVEAQQQARPPRRARPRICPTSMTPTDGLGGFLSQFALTLGPVPARHAIRLGGRHSGPTRLRA